MGQLADFRAVHLLAARSGDGVDAWLEGTGRLMPAQPALYDADTLTDPDEAFEISKTYVEGLEDGRKPVLEASLPLWQASTLGLSDAASWQNTQDILLQAGLMDAPLPDLTAVFSNEFVLANGE